MISNKTLIIPEISRYLEVQEMQYCISEQDERAPRYVREVTNPMNNN